MNVLRVSILVATISMAGLAFANSEGPIPGFTGAPGLKGGKAEMTCQSCHADYALNPDKLGRVELLGVPAVYVPGKSYTLTLQLKHPAAKRWGFQLTALSVPNYAAAGDFTPLDKTTQKKAGAGRQYIEQGSVGGKATGMGKVGGHSWTFLWTAPKTNVGNVAFFAAANMANGNGDMTGDRIYASARPLFMSRAGGK